MRATVKDTPASAEPPSSPAPLRRIAIIAAVADNGVIGIDNGLPWRVPEDLRRFRSLTVGHSVIMGRRTWDSIGKPLAGRQNIVVSRSRELKVQGAQVAPSLDRALTLARMPDPVFVIGGEALYREALPVAELMFLTEIHRDFAGDAFFPNYPREAWEEISREPHGVDGSHGFAYDFATYRRSGI